MGLLDIRLKLKSQIVREAKETTRKAYLGARAKIRDKEKKMDGEAVMKVGSASVMVVNGGKLVMGYMGDYRAVVCRNGVAKQTTSKRQQSAERHWTQRIIPDSEFHAIRLNLVCTKTSLLQEGEIMYEHGFMRFEESTEVILAGKMPRISLKAPKSRLALRGSTHTEFIILGSSGIWEVMNDQEAVNLVRHIENPQEASQCLAKEALTRMSKGSISCLVIHFED